MPSSYHRDHANALSSIYQQMGQAQAQARLQQGQGWANAFGQIAQTVGAIPGQVQASKDAETQRQRMAQQDARMVQQDARLLQQDQREAEDRAKELVLRNAFAAAMGPDGRVDHARLQENLRAQGMGHIAPEAIETWQKMEIGWLNLQHAIDRGVTDRFALGELRDNYLGPAAVRWMAAQPGLEQENIFEGALFNMESVGLDRQAAAYRTLAKENPGVFESMMRDLAARYQPKPELTNVPEGTVVWNETTGQPVFFNRKLKTLTEQFAAAETAAERSAIIALIRQEAQAKHISAAATFEWAKLPDGTVRYMTPPEIRAQGATKAEAHKPATEDERKTYGFAVQMGQAITIMDELESKLTETELYQIQTLPQEALLGWANRRTTSEAAKRYLRAFEQFTESRLRPVSGAAIKDSEYARDRRTYAKQYGETPQLATDRKGARNSALEALQTRAGSMYRGAPPASGAPERPTLSADGFTVMTAAGPMTFPTKEAALGYYRAIGGGQ